MSNMLFRVRLHHLGPLLVAFVCTNSLIAPERGCKNGYFCNFTKTCGVGQPKPYMLSGKDIDLSEFPSIAQLLIKPPKREAFVCLGAIVSDYHIVSAAKCVGSEMGNDTMALPPSDEVKAYVGSSESLLKRIRDRPYSTPIGGHVVKSLCLHPLHDVVLLRLKMPLRFGKNKFQPACIAVDMDADNDWHEDIYNTTCFQLGFGVDLGKSSGSPELARFLRRMPVRMLFDCNYFERPPRDRLCFLPVLKKREETELTEIDHGGPTICQNKRTKQWTVVGIALKPLPSLERYQGGFQAGVFDERLVIRTLNGICQGRYN